MLKIRYAKETYGPKCQNTHGPKLWLLDSWAWAHGPGPMGPGCGPPAGIIGSGLLVVDYWYWVIGSGLLVVGYW